MFDLIPKADKLILSIQNEYENSNFSFSVLLFFACNKPIKEKEEVHSLKSKELDSLFLKYAIMLDATFNYKNDTYFNWIIKYLKNDTLFERNQLKEIIQSRLNIGFRRDLSKFNEFSLNELNCEEAYRFILWRAFVRYVLLITAVKKTGEYYLQTTKINFKDTLRYGNKSEDSLIFQKRIKINKSEWDTLVGYISASYFWSMFPSTNEPGYFDGSWWSYEGFEKEFDYKLKGIGLSPIVIKNHRASRQCPPDGSYKDIGLYLIKISKVDVGEIY
jgi:hypothetical protein